uniref:Selenoprotein P n=1 Tax=Sus scrofa TaxID=9823 RepID=A0A8D1VAU7_PIG
MWRGLGLALALCFLSWGGTESQGKSSFCEQPPGWSIKDQDPMLNSYGSVTVVALLQASCYLCILQASRLEDLRVKLEKEGYSNISYIVVNHQGIASQLKYVYLKSKVSEHIPVYQQEENQTDVWTLLNGNKDDFLIYDRCGLLVYHLGLPYSFLTFPYVEEAIKTVYCENKCGNCSLKTLKDEDFCKNVYLATEEKTTEAPQPHHHHDHHHHRHHHHHHGHQHLGNGHLSEHPKPEAPDAPEQPPPSGLHHHHGHKGHQRQGHSENCDMPAGSESLQLSLPQKKLCRRGCISQLLCKFPKNSESALRSCCCHCRHLIFEKTESAVTCQCGENLPSLCSCQGLLAEENVIESCQCRLPPAACQASQQLNPAEASTKCSCKNKAGRCKCPSK